MSAQYVSSVTTSRNNAYQEIDVLDGVTSDWYIFPHDTRHVGVDLDPSGTAKIQTSNDITKMEAGTDTGIDWNLGAVTSKAGDTSIGVRGFRVVSISGAARAVLNAVFS